MAEYQKYIFRRIGVSRAFTLGAIIVFTVCLLVLLTPVLMTDGPNKMAIKLRFQSPSWSHLFGTDNLGRDVLSRVLYGGRLSLWIGFWVVALNATFGVLMGAVAGYFERLDNPLMRFADALMAFPAVLLAIGIAAALQPSVSTVIIALSVVYIPRTARVVRASVLTVKELEFVLAARSLGVRTFKILWSHVLPNCWAPLIVQLSFVFAYAILTEAVLSFLGIGAPPTTPSWGVLISEGRGYMREAPWLTAAPGIAIAITVLGLNLLGDGLRDVLDPRLNLQT